MVLEMQGRIAGRSRIFPQRWLLAAREPETKMQAAVLRCSSTIARFCEVGYSALGPNRKANCRRNGNTAGKLIRHPDVIRCVPSEKVLRSSSKDKKSRLGSGSGILITIPSR